MKINFHPFDATIVMTVSDAHFHVNSPKFTQEIKRKNIQMIIGKREVTQS